jgi:dTDP-4-dehydrorhamnose 3,5-epimerase
MGRSVRNGNSETGYFLMRLLETPLQGLYVIELAPQRDSRGAFARTFCRETFRKWGLRDCSLQNSISINTHAATLRGMHYQERPHEETKLVRCSRGRIFDVVVDLRSESESRGRWYGIELSALDLRQLYIPPGFAHGFITLEDNSEVYYQMAEPFVADAARGFHWQSPQVGIAWPIAPQIVSSTDATLPSEPRNWL